LLVVRVFFLPDIVLWVDWLQVVQNGLKRDTALLEETVWRNEIVLQINDYEGRWHGGD